MNSIKDTVTWFKLAVPNPTRDNLSVQIGCHLEEVAEMADALSFDQQDTEYLHRLGDRFKNKDYTFKENRLELLDALADQIVTAVGIAHMLNMDIAGALDEVNRSNFSKFENGMPVFKANGKISKGCDYVEPDLTKFV